MTKPWQKEVGHRLTWMNPDCNWDCHVYIQNQPPVLMCRRDLMSFLANPSLLLSLHLFSPSYCYHYPPSSFTVEPLEIFVPLSCYYWSSWAWRGYVLGGTEGGITPTKHGEIRAEVPFVYANTFKLISRFTIAVLPPLGYALLLYQSKICN